MSLLNDKVINKPFVYMWQYKANNVNNAILKNPLLVSHQRILQNNGYLYYIGIHQDTNPNYAHSSVIVEALGLPRKVDYDNLPPGWKRRIIFIGEDYKQVQAMEIKLLEKAYNDHDWDKYLNKAWWFKGHLYGGIGEDSPTYKHGLRGGKNRHNPEVHREYDRKRYRKNKLEKIKNLNKTKNKENKMVTNEMAMKTLLFGSRTGDVEGVKAFLTIVANESAKSTTVNTNSIYDKTVERTDGYLIKILDKETTELFESTGLPKTEILTVEELAKGLGYKTVEFNSIIGGALGKELGNGVSVYRMTGEEPTNKASWLRELVIPKSEIPSIEKTLNRSYND